MVRPTLIIVEDVNQVAKEIISLLEEDFVVGRVDWDDNRKKYVIKYWKKKRRTAKAD